MEKKVEILLVEDDPGDAEIAIRALQRNNICNSLLHLHDGEEALDYLFANGIYEGRNINDVPKVILLDLKMPKIDGIDVLKKIKSNSQTHFIPVVLFTSSSEEKDILNGYKCGVNSYIVKPVEFDDFVKAIAQVGVYWLSVNQHAK